MDSILNKAEIKNAGLQKSIDDVLQRSFNMNVFNDSFEKLNKIAEENYDNPAQLEIDADAYIDGTLSEIQGDTKEVYDVLKTQRDGLVDQAFRRFTANQVDNAENQITHGIYKAGKIAIDSYKKKLPEKIQVLESANYIKSINDGVADGRLSQNQGITLYEDFARDIIVNHLGDILRNPSVSTEEKMEWVYKMVDGKTGEIAVDNASADLRMKAVQSVLSANKQIDDYNKHLNDGIKTGEKNAWEDRQLALLNYASQGGDSQTVLDMMDFQKKTALSLEDFNRVDDVYKALERKTNVRVKNSIDNALLSDELTKQEKLDLIHNNEQFLSIDDARKYIDRINDPIEDLMKTSQVKLAKQEAIALYGYNPMGENNALEYFNFALMSGLSSASSQKDIQDAISNAFSKTDSMYSERTSAGRTRQVERFVEKYKTTPDVVNAMIITKIRELDKKAITDRKLREKITPQAEAEVIHNLQIENNLTYQDATAMLLEAKRINQEQ